MRKIKLGLLLALPFALTACGEEEEPAPVPVAEAPVAEVQPTVPPVAPEPIAQTAGIPVSQIIESPATWTGKTVAGEVQVAQVISDRGFFITDQGERLFVVISEPPGETINIEPNQTLRIREATVLDVNATEFRNIVGDLDPETRRTLEQQPVALLTDAQNINILGAAGTGTM